MRRMAVAVLVISLSLKKAAWWRLVVLSLFRRFAVRQQG